MELAILAVSPRSCPIAESDYKQSTQLCVVEENWNCQSAAVVMNDTELEDVTQLVRICSSTLTSKVGLPYRSHLREIAPSLVSAAVYLRLGAFRADYYHSEKQTLPAAVLFSAKLPQTTFSELLGAHCSTIESDAPDNVLGQQLLRVQLRRHPVIELEGSASTCEPSLMYLK